MTDTATDFGAFVADLAAEHTPCAWQVTSRPDPSAADHGPARWMLRLEKHRRDTHIPHGFDTAPACDQCVQMIIADAHAVSYPRTCGVCGYRVTCPADRYEVTPL